jgi:hypothetical protein
MSDMQNDEADADFLSASPAVRKLYEAGTKMANVDFSEIENRRKQALEEKKAALRRGYDALMAQKPDNSAEMLLSMSRGFLSPTRTGSFAESMGNVAGELSPALQRQREMERQHRAQAQQYETGIADVGAQQAQNEYDALMKRAEAGWRLQREAASLASADARARENREMRREIAALAAGRDAGYHFDTVELGDEQAKRMGVSPGAYRVAIDKRDPSKMSLVGPAQNKQGQRLASDERKELMEAIDTISTSERALSTLNKAIDLSPKAYAGAFAGSRASLVANARHYTGQSPSESADATRRYETLVTEQALSQLKSIFGAAPTEGERKILVEMQASVDKTPAQREAILKDAIEAVKARIASAKAKSEMIKTGEYKQPAPSAAPAAPSAAPAAPSAAPASPPQGGARFLGFE